MKLTILFLMLGMLQVSAMAFSQPIQVNFSRSEITVGDALATIEKNSEFKFFYRNDQVDINQVVKVDNQYTSMEELLDNLFANTDIKYRLMENNLVILTKDIILPVDITGKVSANTGESLPGATVMIKGTKTGVITDINGNFSINAEKGDILVFSFIGFQNMEVKVGDGPVNVVLIAIARNLDEVQVIGYGKTTKRLSTGNIASVKGASIAAQPVSNPLLALAGRATGVAISSGGALGQSVDILIRGKNSITGKTAPLILVDGVVVSTDDLVGSSTSPIYSGTSPLNFINSSDIESIDILKDADATSIYGSRGTNGVILITTKKAVQGQTRVTLNTYTGFNYLPYKLKMMNTQEYLQMRNDAFTMGNLKGAGTAVSPYMAINPITPTTTNAPDLSWGNQTTDWIKYYAGNPAPIYNADMSIQGGIKSINYTASAQYSKQNDIYRYNPYQERLIGKLNLQSSLFNDRVILNIGTWVGSEHQMQGNPSNGSSTDIKGLHLPPNFTQYKTDGTLQQDIPGGGALYSLINSATYDQIKTNVITRNFINTASIKVNICKGLDVKAEVSSVQQSADLSNITYYGFKDDYYTAYQGPNAVLSNRTYRSFNFEPQITYEGKIWKGKISALAGATSLKQTINDWTITVKDPGSDGLLESWGASNPSTVPYSNKTQYKFNSVFARAIYNIDNTYIVNATFRRDGSSRFGNEYKFGNFYSVGGAWIFSSLKTIKENLSFLYFGKLRASYGTTGSDAIGDYSYVSLLEGGNGYNGSNSLSYAGYANPGVHWEQTDKFDVGLELGFFNDRIHISSTYYKTKATDLLVKIPLADQTGFSSYIGNFPGVVQNQGFEFELRTSNLSSNSRLIWITNFNISTNQNKLNKFPGLERSVYANTLKIGRAVTSNTYMEMPYHFSNIDPATGIPVFMDMSGDGQINSSDFLTNAAWIGSSRPKYYGGLTNTLTYKGFSLDFSIQFSNQTMTKWTYHQIMPGMITNMPKDIVGNYWKTPGDEAKYPRLYTGIVATGDNAAAKTALNTYYPNSDATLVKGTFYRLKNLELTYLLNSAWLQKAKITNARVYVRGENLFFYTKEFLGKDPETNTPWQAGPLKQYVFGLQLSF